MRFVDVPAKTIELEDATKADVAPIRISEYCVTIAEFVQFEEATGYITRAELECGSKLYKCNELVEHCSESKRFGETAFCLSYLDAIHFCEWAKARLPTEVEWVAAMLEGARVYKITEREQWTHDVQLISDRLKGGKREITSTRTASGSVIVRSGPRYFREWDWREYVDEHRRMVAPGAWDLLYSFRIVESEGIAAVV